jgi:hypothetical protein
LLDECTIGTVAWWVYPQMAASFVTYVFAGWQTWKLLFLTDPLNDICPLELARRRGQNTYGIQAFFIALWPLLLGVGWLNSFLDDGGWAS